MVELFQKLAQVWAAEAHKNGVFFSLSLFFCATVSKEKASNVYRDRYGRLPFLRLGCAKAILFTLINYKTRKSSQLAL